MLGIGPWELLMIISILSLSGLPAFFLWRILSKAGYLGAWALFGIFPLFAVIILGFLAFAEWPDTKRELT